MIPFGVFWLWHDMFPWSRLQWSELEFVIEFLINWTTWWRMEYEAVCVAFTLMEKLILSINLNVVTREKNFATPGDMMVEAAQEGEEKTESSTGNKQTTLNWCSFLVPWVEDKLFPFDRCWGANLTTVAALPHLFINHWQFILIAFSGGKNEEVFNEKIGFLHRRLSATTKQRQMVHECER